MQKSEKACNYLKALWVNMEGVKSIQKANTYRLGLAMTKKRIRNVYRAPGISSSYLFICHTLPKHY